MMPAVSEQVLKRRAAVERWKANNREYYLRQKRELSARPEYRAKMRARYAAQREKLTEAGLLPRKLGRPRLYEGEEAIEIRRHRSREAATRYRLRKISQLQKKDESTSTSSSQEAD